MSLATARQLTCYGGQMPLEYLTVDYLSRKDLARIFSKIYISTTRFHKRTPCWEWTGQLSVYRYGRVWLHGSTESIHRVIFAWLVRPIPRGLGRDIPQLDHLCNNTRCCNPVHLLLTTMKANILRSSAPSAINATKTSCINGHPFTEENVYYRKSGKAKGARICKICASESHQRRMQDPERRKGVRVSLKECARRIRSTVEGREKARVADRKYRQRLKARSLSE